MSLSFPLYDTLISNIESEGITEDSVDRNKIVKNIHTLDQDGKNKVYALIRYYNQKNDENSSTSFTGGRPTDITILPYEGQMVDNDLVFDLDRFPSLLQIILSEFCKLHIKHMKYNQKIEKIRKKST
jgi:hypothetical protein